MYWLEGENRGQDGKEKFGVYLLCRVKNPNAPGFSNLQCQLGKKWNWGGGYTPQKPQKGKIQGEQDHKRVAPGYPETPHGGKSRAHALGRGLQIPKKIIHRGATPLNFEEAQEELEKI